MYTVHTVHCTHFTLYTADFWCIKAFMAYFLTSKCGSFREHRLFVQLNQITKKVSGFNHIFREYYNFWRQIFVILSLHKSFLGSFEVPHQVWVRSVQPFRRLLAAYGQLQTNKQNKFNICRRNKYSIDFYT